VIAKYMVAQHMRNSERAGSGHSLWTPRPISVTRFQKRLTRLTCDYKCTRLLVIRDRLTKERGMTYCGGVAAVFSRRQT